MGHMNKTMNKYMKEITVSYFLEVGGISAQELFLKRLRD